MATCRIWRARTGRFLVLVLLVFAAGCAGEGHDPIPPTVMGVVLDGSTAPAQGVSAQLAIYEEDGVTPVPVLGASNIVTSNLDGSFRVSLPWWTDTRVVNVVASSAAAPATTAPADQTVIIPAAADAYVDDTARDANFGSAAGVLVENGVREGFVRFDLTGLSGTLLAARLQMVANTATVQAGAICTVPETTWGEGTVNWNTRPSLGATIRSAGSVAAGVLASWDVTAEVLSILGASGTAIGFGLAGAAPAADFLSKEGAIVQGRPELIPRLFLVFEGPSGGGGGPTDLIPAAVAVQMDGTAAMTVVLSNTAVTGRAVGSDNLPAVGVDVMLERSDGAGGWSTASLPGVNPGATDALGQFYFAIPSGGAGDYRLTFFTADGSYTALTTSTFPVVTSGSNQQGTIALEGTAGGGGGPPTGGGVSFAADVQPIFNAHCACHLTATGAPQGESLLEGMAYSMIVGVPATELPTMNRIEPGQPDDSFLIIKIDDGSSNVGLRVGDRMPRGMAPLSPGEIATIRQWVTEGALNN